MMNLNRAIQDWKSTKEGWKVAPPGLLWITGGHLLRINGRGIVNIDKGIIFSSQVTIGEGSVIGKNSWIKECCDIGAYCDIGDGVILGTETRIDSQSSIANNVSIGAFVRIGKLCQIGNGVSIGDSVHLGSFAEISSNVTLEEGISLGEGITVGIGARDVLDLGWVEGYRKCMAQVDGVAYIGAGCHWFTLKEAIKHWEEYNGEDNAKYNAEYNAKYNEEYNEEYNVRDNAGDCREITLIIMKSAKRIAKLRGWKLG